MRRGRVITVRMRQRRGEYLSPASRAFVATGVTPEHTPAFSADFPGLCNRCAQPLKGHAK